MDTSDFDVLAITTYFRYDYENYIYNNWNNRALTHEDFYNHILDQMGTDPFQRSETPHGHAGTAACYEEAADLNVPVVTYEGNEHFNMTGRVDTDNDGNTDTPIQDAAPGSLEWMHAFAKTKYMYDLLEKYQLRHEASRLKSHVPFVAVELWSENGQWGYAEYLGQPLDEAPKYKWLHDHFNLPYPNCGIVLTSESEDKEIEIQANIRLFPNPVVEAAVLELQHRLPLVQLEIFTGQGGRLAKIIYRDAKTLLLDMHSYAPGIYFIKVTGNAQGPIVMKVAKKDAS